ncbi:heparan sulfate 2-O-sulfotransferase pipe-like isoform X1 [Scaptodrosophila lebanonensis]|uniref:Heparan sulfate 2-O-sulfotransferase pipe-like isoform X1 n=1 Tax=Drosophila lebanonensis TaxID=7225 RepID=A0A6J2TDU3_DROLE|nr:heparan sulfate 2-O-sulfotransferase pipe-like isoform X1 [Scaptodrosophila lebanonensis]
MSPNSERSYKMKLRDMENAFKYRRIPYPKRSVELIALLAISCTFFLFMHTNKLNSRLKEMEVKLQPSEFSALGLTGNHISGHDTGKPEDINTLHGTYQYLKSTGQRHVRNVHARTQLLNGEEKEPDSEGNNFIHDLKNGHNAQHHLHKAETDKQLVRGDIVNESQRRKSHKLREAFDDEDEDEDDDVDEDEGFNLDADLLNNTKLAEVDFVFFNRVPKVGSQSLMELMQRLGKVNGFQHGRNKGRAHETVLMGKDRQKELIADLLIRQKPHIYSQHIAYINFTRFHLPRPIYINLVRHPVERIISWHYYIRARWYYRDMKDKLGDEAPPMPSDEFLDMDLDTCVRTKNEHCTFEQMQMKNPVGDHRRQVLFFCGMNQKVCMPFNSPVAMQRAKRTVEAEYAVVGTWEDTNITLSVLEHYIPRYFRNAKVAYYLGLERLSNVNRNNVTRIVSEETRQILSKNLTNEIEFYEFCKQRLYLQYAALTQGKRLGDDDYLLVPDQRNEYNEDY